MRQHVNPLSSYFQLPIELPSPQELFANSELPIHLDIGSARGKFLLSMASLDFSRNHLGVEIRKPLVVTAERERAQLDLPNLRFIFCNANVSLENWLSRLPANCLEMVSIQFPDPWFKKRHQKRRVLQPSLLLALSDKLQPSCQLFMQSDIKGVLEGMKSLVDISGCFDSAHNQNELGLAKSPFPIPTERESYALAKGLPIYRALYIRNNMPLPGLPKFEVTHQSFQT